MPCHRSLVAGGNGYGRRTDPLRFSAVVGRFRLSTRRNEAGLMRFTNSALLCLAVLLTVLFVGCTSKKEAQSPGVEEAVSTAVDAYLYGYPLITFDVARMQQTNVAVPDAEHAPMGQMIRMRTYPAV